MGAKYAVDNKYRLLYSRYFERKPEELLALVGPMTDKKVLDICGGNGRASIAALAMGASRCTLVDSCLEMIPDDLDARIRVENADVCIALRFFCPVTQFGFSPNTSDLYEVAVCQQGINYWFSKDAIRLLYEAMVPGGIFIFNTFNQRPSTKPMVKEYEHKGLHYAEISWCLGEEVHHVQICQGTESHTTKFQWIPSITFKTVMKPWFEVIETKHGKTSIYKCVRRDGKLNE